MASMIRRFYILPVNPGVSEAKVQEMIDVLNAADRFILGLMDSSAGVDLDSPTVIWENTFVDEASYSGPYMVHPYHIGAIDNYVMPDSPECITDNTYATRYTTPDAVQEVRGGIRRVLLLNASTDADGEALNALAAQPRGVAASAFGADDVGWVSAKGRPWTHIWEQSFTDMAQLERYLDTPDGTACSSQEGFASLGINLGSLKVFTCPFELSPAEDQSPPEAPPDTSPVLYTITARTAADRRRRLRRAARTPLRPVHGRRRLSAPQSLAHRGPGLPRSRSALHLADRFPQRLQRPPGHHHFQSALDGFRQDATPLVQAGPGASTGLFESQYPER